MTEEPLDEPHVEAIDEAPPSEDAPVSIEPASVPAESRNSVQPKRSLAITRLIQALWLGSGAFLLLSASAAFGAASNTTDAANVVGAILTRWHYIGLFAPLALLFLEWRRNRPAMLVLLFVAILLASFQALLDTRIRMMRLDSIVPISSLPHDDPVRRQFGFLHGLSSLFLIGQVIAAGTAVATRE